MTPEAIRFLGTSIALILCSSVFLIVGKRMVAVTVTAVAAAVLCSIAYARSFDDINGFIALPIGLALCACVLLLANVVAVLRGRG
jgi:hypothetical protein